MESLSREAILRMVGLHDASHMVRQLNAIQLSLEEEQGRMVAYWTEIRKSEKEVTLLAGRMTDAETNIGQLQVTAQQITASVSSLTTTVNGHTTSIGQLTITANNLTASVSSISDTVNGHTTSIGQLQITANNLTASVTTIEDTVNGHTTSIGALEIESNRVSNRVTVIEGDYVKNAQITLMVVKNGDGYISNALIDADDIDFVFTRAVSWYWQSKTDANKRMGLDSNGDLWIAGEYKGGSITGNISVGTGTNKMYIQPNEQGGAQLIGKSGNDTVLELGFFSSEYPYLHIGQVNHMNSNWVQLEWHRLRFGYGPEFGVDRSSSIYKILICGTWPTSASEVMVGQVYRDGDVLKVRTS